MHRKHVALSKNTKKGESFIYFLSKVEFKYSICIKIFCGTHLFLINPFFTGLPAVKLCTKFVLEWKPNYFIFSSFLSLIRPARRFKILGGGGGQPENVRILVNLYPIFKILFFSESCWQSKLLGGKLLPPQFRRPY